MNFRPVIFLSSLLVAGCAPAKNVVPGDYNPSIISQYELNQSHTITAIEAIRRLRPQWLNYRAQTSVREPNPPPPVVYSDEQAVGDMSILNQILVTQIESITFFKPTEAMIKYGTDRTSGVIAVKTKKIR